MAASIMDGEIVRRLSLLFPPPDDRSPPRHPIRWAVGIVAAPRRGTDYLTETIVSVGRAGFPKPWVFAEPGMPGIAWDAEKGAPALAGYDGPVTVNGDRCGVWPNHMAACWALRHSQATADCNAYLILEDDSVLCRGLRRYLDEFVCWPVCETQIGAILLFTHKMFSRIGPGWHQWTPAIYYTIWGAQALVFSRPGIDAWIASPFHCQHREQVDAAANRFADTELTSFCERSRRPIYFACGRSGESLVAHVGQESSVFGAGPGSMPGRTERIFADTTTLASTWFDPPPLTKKEREPQPVESAEDRRDRRLAVCRTCNQWDEAEGCRACSNVEIKPTIANVGTIKARCRMGKWA